MSFCSEIADITNSARTELVALYGFVWNSLHNLLRSAALQEKHNFDAKITESFRNTSNPVINDIITKAFDNVSSFIPRTNIRIEKHKARHRNVLGDENVMQLKEQFDKLFSEGVSDKFLTEFQMHFTSSVERRTDYITRLANMIVGDMRSIFMCIALLETKKIYDDKKSYAECLMQIVDDVIQTAIKNVSCMRTSVIRKTTSAVTTSAKNISVGMRYILTNFFPSSL